MPPTLWGTQARLVEIFAGHQLTISRQIFAFRYRSPEHWLEVFKTYYGRPTAHSWRSMRRGRPHCKLDSFNRSGDGTLVAPGEYLEVIVTKG